jgi:hypothetical protein
MNKKFLPQQRDASQQDNVDSFGGSITQFAAVHLVGLIA